MLKLKVTFFTIGPGVGLGCNVPAAVSFRSGSARLGRSQKDGLPSACGAFHGLRGSRPSTRAQGRGSLIAAPFNRDRNGREGARPYFACRPLAVLRNGHLGRGSRYSGLGLFCARSSRDLGRSSATPAMMAPFAKGLAARVAAIEKPRKSCGAKSRGTNALGGLPRTA
jgi:hypothetical protein